jgi:isochorismate synthase EntC
LDITYFKPFKTTFKKERNRTMINKNYIELNKIVLARWVDKTLNQTLARKNIISKFKSTRI